MENDGAQIIVSPAFVVIQEIVNAMAYGDGTFFNLQRITHSSLNESNRSKRLQQPEKALAI